MTVRAAPNAGRLVKVSLRHVPLKQRRRAAHWLLEATARAGGYEALKEAEQITRAILLPSEEHYLLPEKAVREVLGYVPNGEPLKYSMVEVGETTILSPDGVA